jgi:hypothetical protein
VNVLEKENCLIYSVLYFVWTPHGKKIITFYKRRLTAYFRINQLYIDQVFDIAKFSRSHTGTKNSLTVGLILHVIISCFQSMLSSNVITSIRFVIISFILLYVIVWDDSERSLRVILFIIQCYHLKCYFTCYRLILIYNNPRLSSDMLMAAFTLYR